MYYDTIVLFPVPISKIFVSLQEHFGVNYSYLQAM